MHSPHYSGVKPIGCVHKFHHFAGQNAIGSALIACLCFPLVPQNSEFAQNITVLEICSIVVFDSVLLFF